MPVIGVHCKISQQAACGAPYIDIKVFHPSRASTPLIGSLRSRSTIHLRSPQFTLGARECTLARLPWVTCEFSSRYFTTAQTGTEPESYEMKLETYKNVMKDIKNFRGMSKDCDKMLRDKYSDISADTLSSILSLEVQRRMKFNHAKLSSQGSDYYEKYVNAVERGEPIGVLLRLSQETTLEPALLARIILEHYCEAKKMNASRAEITKLFKDTTLIEDKDLACEVYLCILHDNQYGPIADAIKHSIGHEYEVKLQNFVSERRIAFHDENHLRSRGYDKTPDIKLEVPIAVDGFVVNWIESKALFGNEEVHRKYINEQFLSYWNRFGPGLVIYWFGFLDTLNQLSEKKFIISDNFPANITFMDPCSIKMLST